MTDPAVIARRRAIAADETRHEAAEARRHATELDSIAKDLDGQPQWKGTDREVLTDALRAGAYALKQRARNLEAVALALDPHPTTYTGKHPEVEAE